MKMVRRASLGIVAGLVLVGLCACQPPAPASPKGYFGKTEPMERVVERINENNSRIPTLWARHSFEVWVVNPKDKSTDYLNGDGHLMYMAPGSIWMDGNKELADLFELGSNGSKFWLFNKHNDVFWWGNYADLDKPGTKDIPIRPDLILEVLGARPINPELTVEPFPVMRFNNDSDVYMLDWVARGADKYVVVKEIWYERVTLHPSLVLLFDVNGRVVLRAYLSNYEPVEVQDVSKEQWPQIATYYRLFFPDTGSKMNFTLRSLATMHGGHPRPDNFNMPDPEQLRKDGIKIIPIHEESGS